MGCLSPLTAVTLLQLGDLAELELDGRLPSEDVDQDLELELVIVDLGDLAGEIGERPSPDPHALPDLVLQAGPRLLLGLGALDLDLEDALDLLAGEGRGLGPQADEARDAGRFPRPPPRVVVEI